MDFASMFILICICILNAVHANSTESNLQTYIVHVEGPGASWAAKLADLDTWYRSFLPATTKGPKRMLYSYRKVFKGFAAKLSPEEAAAMETKAGFISARPEKILSKFTTHSPNFLGLNQNAGFWNASNYGRGVIIGVLDVGILPNHPSFSDAGMPPPPAKWNGWCEFGGAACNNKLIGARYFPSSYGETPIDEEGHGTHTAGTAAGNFVTGANLFGSGNGTAAGVAPLAHLAIYKVCTPECTESNIIAAMDAAIEDGVDVLSISLGGHDSAFYSSNLALGAFSAVANGIVVSCAAGNGGPFIASTSNEAPWILTVGASTMDRKIRATAVLGNNQTFDGESAFQPSDFPATLSPLVFPQFLIGDTESAYCTARSLSRINVRGKVVVCELGVIGSIEKGIAVKNAGGAAMILINPEMAGSTTNSEAHVLPATEVSYADGLKIKAYIRSIPSPTATIVFKGTVIGDDRAPVVAAFSSRGPNRASPGILKPDILGPGVNILAAWHASIDNTNFGFNFQSGTSMSCPHLSGVAALLKSTHPDWSPAAIKSAIMTTADVVNLAQSPIQDERLLPASVLATGSGHVNPSRANNPGLVYDIRPDEYVPYLCGLRYTNSQVSVIMQRWVNCRAVVSIQDSQLNYPSFALTFSPFRPSTQTYSRTVTNVGEPISSYVVEVVAPPGVSVRVAPTRLEFSARNQKLQYSVTFTRTAAAPTNTVVQGFLKWNGSGISVRSPIAVILQ